MLTNTHQHQAMASKFGHVPAIVLPTHPLFGIKPCACEKQKPNYALTNDTITHHSPRIPLPQVEYPAVQQAPWPTWLFCPLQSVQLGSPAV